MERAPHARLTQNRGLHSLWHTIPQKSAYDPIGSILKVEIQRFLPEAYLSSAGTDRVQYIPDSVRISCAWIRGPVNYLESSRAPALYCFRFHSAARR
jgi:hypothetical protein